MSSVMETNIASPWTALNDIKPGDPVEFEMHYDRQNGKPLACKLVKLQPGSVSFEVLSDQKVVGTIVSEARPSKSRVNQSASNSATLGLCPESFGQVTFEANGEFFFLPYTIEDLENGIKPKTNDQVTFYVATDKRSGQIRARKVSLAKSQFPSRCQGVVCCMKDTYGFIERADVVKEIFFHYSEVKDIDNLVLGDDVEYDIETKNGKEMATNIVRLPMGTVVFEDVSQEAFRGTILRTLKGAHMIKNKEPLSGRIIYESVPGCPVEIPFGERDQVGEYTTYPGDIIKFNVATDRRDKLQRASNIQLLTETFAANKEKREKGGVVTIKEGFGFIRCADRDSRMFFHFNELLEPGRLPKIGDEVEFTVVADPNIPSRSVAIRLKYLTSGSVVFETVAEEFLTGTVEKEPQTHKTPGRNKDQDLGAINFVDKDSSSRLLDYTINGIDDVRLMPKVGDKVQFNLMTEKYTNKETAVNVKVLNRSLKPRHFGYIATLKDNFGFIEAENHDREIFFHFTSFGGEATELELGDEVEYTLVRKNGKVSADHIKLVTPTGTVNPDEILPETYRGKVIRPLRIVDPDQESYPGLVQMGNDDKPSPDKIFEYGITGLTDKRDFLQSGDACSFQLCTSKRDGGAKRATNICGVRNLMRAKVDSVKGQYGFIDYEAVEGRKLFFHMTEVHDRAAIQAGDEVDFVVIQNQRNGRYSACSVRKVSTGLTSPAKPSSIVTTPNKNVDSPSVAKTEDSQASNSV